MICSDQSDIKTIMIVVDTNIFIGQLSQLKQILGSESVALYLPWVVVNELDRLKDYQEDRGRQARAAIGFIHKLLVDKSPKVCSLLTVLRFFTNEITNNPSD